MVVLPSFRQLLGSLLTFLFFFLLDEDGNRKFTFPSRKSRKEPLEPLQLNSPTEEYYPRTRTVATPRSRAPSLRSTPSGRRSHYAVHNNTAAPTRSLYQPVFHHRSNSQGLHQTNSWGVSNIPKSAKQWGRTAHLHEVKSAVPRSVFSSTGSGNGQKTRRGSSERLGPRFDHDRAKPPNELEFGSQDVFSVLRPDDAKDEVTMTGKAGSKVPGLLFKGDLAVDDGDPWVDTDSVSSESGTDVFAKSEF